MPSPREDYVGRRFDSRERYNLITIDFCHLPAGFLGCSLVCVIYTFMVRLMPYILRVADQARALAPQTHSRDERGSHVARSISCPRQLMAAAGAPRVPSRWQRLITSITICDT